MKENKLFDRAAYEELKRSQENPETMVDDTTVESTDSSLVDEEIIGRRRDYHYGMDRFLNNGILVVGVLLLAVILIAFFV